MFLLNCFSSPVWSSSPPEQNITAVISKWAMGSARSCMISDCCSVGLPVLMNGHSQALLRRNADSDPRKPEPDTVLDGKVLSRRDLSSFCIQCSVRCYI